MYSLSASANASSFLLGTITAVSLMLALAAAGELLLLLVMRPLRERLQRRATIRRQRIRLLLNRALASPYDTPTEDLRRLAVQFPKDVIVVAAEILRNLRGGDVKRLTALLGQCNMLDALRQAARHSSRANRIRAFVVLSHFPGDVAADILAGQVLAADPNISLAALRGMAAMGLLPSYDDVLLPLFRRGQNLPLIADTMQRFGEPATADLSRLANRPGLPVPSRVAALQALAAIGTPECAEVALHLCGDAQPFLRAKAIAVLAEFSDQRTPETILVALDDDDLGVRLAAVRACGAMRLTAAAPRLTRMMISDDWWLRFRAAEAFWSFGESGIAVLRQLAREEGERGLARQFLAEKGMAP